MISKASFSPIFFKALFQRFCKYGLVGISTYAFDLALVYTFKTYFQFPDWLAVALGFLIAISINFIFSYFWVYKGTKQTKARGYLFFLTLATVGLLAVVYLTLFIKNIFGLDLYIARTLTGIIVGTTNFLVNTFFNFKMVY